MDARTDLETKVVGYELAAKRQAAAEARRAKATQKPSTRRADTATRNGRLARIWNTTGGYAMWKKLKGVVIGALLVGLLLGVVGAGSPRTVASGGATQKHFLVREHGAPFTHQKIVARGVGHKHKMM